MLKILIVEDERLIAEDIKLTLIQFSYKVIGIISKGEDALKKLEKSSPDLILMDIMLKGELNGIETSTIINKKYDIPIIFVTAYADDKTIDQATSANPYGFILKPFNSKEIHAVIEMTMVKHKAKKILEESRAKFESMFQGNPEPSVYIDNDFKIVDINPRFTEYFLYTKEEVKGKYIDDLIVPEENKLEAKDLNVKTSQGYVYYDTLRKRKDGVLVPVSISAAPIMIKGKTVGSFVIYKDISKQKKAEVELKLEQTYLEQLFSSAPEGIVLCDNNSNIVRANDEFLKVFGFKRDEIINVNIDEIIASGEQRKEAKEITNKVRSGKLELVETIRFRKDGSKIEVSIVGKPIIHDSKQIGVFGIYRDITERKKAQKEREKLIKELRKALDEIKTLSGLVPICSHCKKIRDDSGYWQKVEEYLSQHADVDFSHGICPECLQKYYPDQYEKMKEKGTLPK